MIKPAYSVSFVLSINIFVWQNVLYFLDAPRISTNLIETSNMDFFRKTLPMEAVLLPADKRMDGYNEVSARFSFRKESI